MSDWDNDADNDGLRIVRASGAGIAAKHSKWAKDLKRWEREAKRAECVERLRSTRNHIDMLWQCAKYTPTGVMMEKRKRTVAMNARYVTRGGKRVYIGKKATDARKAKRAAAARDRRLRESIEIHGGFSGTEARFIQQNRA